MLGLFLIVGLWSMFQGSINYSQSFLNIFLFCSFLNVLYNQCIVILNNPPCFLFPLDIKNTHCCYCTQKDRVCLASWGQGLKQGETVSLAPRLTKNAQTNCSVMVFLTPGLWADWHDELPMTRWWFFGPAPLSGQLFIVSTTFSCRSNGMSVVASEHQTHWVRTINNVSRTLGTVKTDLTNGEVRGRWADERSRWCTWMEGSSKVHQ